MAIPVVDLAGFSGDAKQKAAFVSQLGKAYEEVGFVAVKNHGIPPETIDGLYRNTKEFFSLPPDTKRKYEIPGLAGQRGYTSFGKGTCERQHRTRSEGILPVRPDGQKTATPSGRNIPTT
jgi:isopenicillin N synthase-like dioxygenase